MLIYPNMEQILLGSAQPECNNVGYAGGTVPPDSVTTPPCPLLSSSGGLAGDPRGESVHTQGPCLSWESHGNLKRQETSEKNVQSDEIFGRKKLMKGNSKTNCLPGDYWVKKSSKGKNKTFVTCVPEDMLGDSRRVASSVPSPPPTPPPLLFPSVRFKYIRKQRTYAVPSVGLRKLHMADYGRNLVIDLQSRREPNLVQINPPPPPGKKYFVFYIW